MAGLNRETVNQLQRTFSGLDSNLNFVPGHSIKTKYDGYKAADKAARAASTAYTSTAQELKASKPYDPNNRPSGPVGGGCMYYQAGHQTLAPLAGTASTTAQYHADRRTSFNTKYKPVLEAKGNYGTHVAAATGAQKSANRFAGWQAKHQKYS